MNSTYQQAVIGTVLNDPATMEQAADLLTSDFTGPYVTAWAEIMGLHSRQALGVQAFVLALGASPYFRQFSDVGTADEFTRSCLNYRGGEIGEYVRRVIDESIKRALQRSSALIAAEAQKEGVPTAELLDYAEKQILSLRRTRGNEGITMNDLMSIFIPRIAAIRDGTFQPAWKPHLTALQGVLQFLEKSDYMLIAARPGEGKSSLMRYEFLHHAMQGNPCTIFNLENDEIEYARNFLALMTNIDSRKMKDARLLSTQELSYIHEAAEELRSLPIRLINAPGANVSQIVRQARRCITEQHSTLIGVDYIQLIANRGSENKNADITHTSQELRALALEMGVPVIANAQLSRAIETRSNAGGEASEPQLSDLRESGSLEQDATIVCFPRSMWRNPTPDEIMSFPENVDPRTHRPFQFLKAIPVQIFVRKNRNGTVGVTEPIKWNKATGNYQTLAS